MGLRRSRIFACAFLKFDRSAGRGFGCDTTSEVHTFPPPLKCLRWDKVWGRRFLVLDCTSATVAKVRVAERLYSRRSASLGCRDQSCQFCNAKFSICVDFCLGVACTCIFCVFFVFFLFFWLSHVKVTPPPKKFQKLLINSTESNIPSVHLIRIPLFWSVAQRNTGIQRNRDDINGPAASECLFLPPPPAHTSDSGAVAPHAEHPPPRLRYLTPSGSDLSQLPSANICVAIWCNMPIFFGIFNRWKHMTESRPKVKVGSRKEVGFGFRTPWASCTLLEQTSCRKMKFLCRLVHAFNI